MNVLLRADGSTTMGTGHVTRSLALARALKEAGHEARIASAELASALRKRVDAAGLAVERLDDSPGSAEDCKSTARLSDRLGADWLVVDGYQFSGEYRAALKRASGRLMVIDDLGGVIEADTVLNQNPYADASLYPDVAGERLLLGTRYALLQPEYASTSFADASAAKEDGARVLVAMGGGDAHNMTRTAVLGLARMEGAVEVRVLVGGAHPDPSSVESVAVTSGYTVIRDRPSLIDDLTWCHVVVGAFGTSALEYACAGRPLVGVVLADNQVRLAHSLQELGAAVVVGDVASATPRAISDAVEELVTDSEAMRRMAERGRVLVDGRGARRVVSAMETVELDVREARWNDIELVWRWANDPETRSASFSSQSIPWDSHERWFRERMADPDTLLYIGQLRETPIGIARFERHGSAATVSLNMAPEARGRGLAAPFLRLADARAAAAGVRQIHAYIKRSNSRSLAAFQNAGFVQLEGSAGDEPMNAVLLVCSTAQAAPSRR